MFLRSTIIGIIMALASTASAQSQDAVLVLGVGGVDSVAAFDVVRDPDPRAVNLGPRRVLPVDVGPATITDIKVLPDGSYLLADVSGRGAVVVTPEAEAVAYVLDPLQRYGGAASASVASYFSAGQPSLILLGDSASSSISIRSASSGDVSWFRTLRIATSTATVLQAIVLPENRVAVALTWPEVGVSAVEVHAVDDAAAAPIRFVSATHADSSSSDVVVPELEQVRDLAGLPGGNLLVTSRSDVLELSVNGTVVNHWSTGDFPEVNGELASARPLPSGNIALVTFERGEWVRPHINHRVHWLSPETSQIIATSEVLTRAPSRVEPLRGSGGTGTLGFAAGLNGLEQGDPAAIALDELVLNPESVPLGGVLRARATVTNEGAFGVALASLVLHAAAGPCAEAPSSDQQLAVAESVAIGAGQSYSFGDDVTLDARFGLGVWCAFVEGRDRQGARHRYGDPVPFEVTARDDGAGSRVVVSPLPFGDDIEEPDVGFDGGDDAGPVDDWVAKKGCCATAAGVPEVGDFAPAFALFLLAVVRLRRPRR